MSESGGLSAGEVMALTKDNDMFGGNWGGIIGLLIIAGIFGGNWFGNNGNSNANWDNFIERDIYNANTNVLTSASATQNEILNSKYDNTVNVLTQANNLQNNVLENRYANQLAFANIQKDILLGNQNMLSQMAQCCCDMKTTMHNEGEATRALITENRIQDLQYQLNQANTAVSNAVQTQNILNSLGNYYPKMGVNPTYLYGTTIQ